MVRLSPRSFRVVGEHEQRPTLSSAPAHSEHVGLLLAEARTAAGFKLSDIAYTLRIRYLFLQAIEEGRFADLPGTAYAVGFVRSYADYLGLDAAAVVARFKAETAGARGATSLAFPEPAPERRFFPGAAVLSLSVVLAAAAFGGWVYWQNEPDVIAERISEPPALPAFDLSRQRTATETARLEPPPSTRTESAPEQLAIVAAVDEPEIAPEADPQDQPGAPTIATRDVTSPDAPPLGDQDADEVPATETASAQLAQPEADTPLVSRLSQNEVSTEAVVVTQLPLAIELPASTVPAPPDNRPGGNVTAAIAAEVPVPASEPQPTQLAARSQDSAESRLPAVPLAGALDENAGRVYGRANHDARITLHAIADSWVQVRDGAQNVVLTRMLRSGDSYRVPNKDDLWLLTGNAGGLEILVDGQPVAPLGPSGEVRRNIALDAAALKAR